MVPRMVNKFLRASLIMLCALAYDHAHSAPFLIADPVPASVQPPPEWYEIVIDGAATPVVSPVQKNADGSVQLHFDLSTLSNGAHTLSVSAANVWGKSTAVPFALNKAAPGAPSSIGLSAK
jgi:hypothetical protein